LDCEVECDVSLNWLPTTGKNCQAVPMMGHFLGVGISSKGFALAHSVLSAVDEACSLHDAVVEIERNNPLGGLKLCIRLT
jgi:hypothetical protein